VADGGGPALALCYAALLLAAVRANLQGQPTSDRILHLPEDSILNRPQATFQLHVRDRADSLRVERAWLQTARLVGDFIPGSTRGCGTGDKRATARSSAR
jgi:hypothetical protein